MGKPVKFEPPRWFLTTTALVVGIVTTYLLARLAIGSSKVSVNISLVLVGLFIPAIVASFISGLVNGMEDDGVKVSIGIAMGSEAIGWAVAVGFLLWEQPFVDHSNDIVASDLERKIGAVVVFCILSVAWAGATGAIGGLFGGGLGQATRQKIEERKERRKAVP